MDLEQRLRRLEDLEEIRRVTFDYGHAVDVGCHGKRFDEAALRAVLADGATWSAPERGVSAAGVDAIVELLAATMAGFELGLHEFTNPRIDLERGGDRARATWMLWFAGATARGAAIHLQTEVITYARTAAGWRISTIELHGTARLRGRD